eukprot:CAMPEP_0117431196 /NCGR_PEP_ID=MMETSP0758-20121206/10740_1 /TAXON_ID=63605 /ORGANISM="Percolomonas cosmopolitus, Strain AE-1 (ATCC 50343)" /LENGTH=196 /DNA_ID=CAMNT_0005219983 /DNA_START=30 /DNA_END=617 /DNA_ORIENTATION=-
MKEKDPEVIKRHKVVFISVGTTQFDELIDECLSAAFLEELKRQGFNEMIIQCGHYKGAMRPHMAETAQSSLIREALANEDAPVKEDNVDPITVYKMEKHESLYTTNQSDYPATIELYRFKPSLHDDQMKADLIISHGGAGCIFEALQMKKPLMVAVNHSLQDDHQDELALSLHSQHHLIRCPSPFHVSHRLKQLPA